MEIKESEDVVEREEWERRRRRGRYGRLKMGKYCEVTLSKAL